MATTQRVTITLPTELVEEIDRLEPNRSRFILAGVRRELAHRQREALRRSLEAPHPEASEIAEEGFDEWAERLPPDDPSDLVDPEAGTAVRWVPGKGWVEPKG